MYGNKIFSFVSFFSLVLLLTGCGGGGGGTPPERPAKNITGNAVDAVITNGTIRAFAWDNGIKGELLATAIVDGVGFYDLTIQSTDRPILLEVSDGRYTEEASGVNVQMIEGQTMSALIFYTQNTDVSVQINPFTHLASCFAQFKVGSGQNAQNAITSSTSAFSALTGVDIIGTFPLNVTDPANADFDVNDGHRFGALLAGISSFTGQTSIDNGVTPHRFNQNSSMYFAQVACQDIQADGLLNGQGFINNSSSIGQLALGSVTLSTNSYRLFIPQHVLKIMSSDRNATGLGVEKFVQFANQYAQSTDAMFGTEPPQAVDQEGPVITTSRAENEFLKDIVSLNFQITDPLGVQSVTFDVNGIFHSSGQSDNPILSLNTLSYADGEISIKVTAVDVLNNTSESTFIFNVDNTSPIVELTSPVLTNSQTYQASGTYQPQGSAVTAITANGVPAVLDTVNQTWTAALTLGSGSNTVSLVVTDSVENVGSSNVVVGVDLINPTISVNPTSVTFTTFQGQLNLCRAGLFDRSAQGNPICISTDSVSLDGIEINPNLQFSGYLMVSFTATDPQGAGIFTSNSNLIVEYKYNKNTVEQVGWAPVPVPTNAGGIFYLPVVTEYMGEDWYKGITADNHVITVRVTDSAGNEKELVWRFEIDVLVPALSVTSNTVNSALITGTGFASRASLDGQLINVEYILDNESRTSYFISLSDVQNHNVNLNVESRVRKNSGRIKTATEWRTQLAQRDIDGFYTIRDPAFFDIVSYDLHRAGSRNPSAVINLPAPVFSESMEYQQDIISVAPVSPWQTESSCSRGDLYTKLGSGSNGSLGDAICKNSNQVFQLLQARFVESGESDPGYPRNESKNIETIVNMVTERISVFNDSLGQQILPVSTWYRVPPKTKIKIVKSIRTPVLLHGIDVDVAQAPFTSYIEKKLDLSIAWNIDTDLSITRAIDPGDVSLLPEVTQFTETFGNGIENYLIER